jgi:putative PIN family toxin of toxin-antitoxin system
VRIVIDSNVWVSALVFGGKPRAIFEHVVADGLTIIVSEEIFTEVRRVLAVKFGDFVEDFESFQAILRPYVINVQLGSIKIAVSRDEDDNRVIETAIIGGASHIITGDKDLLVLSKYDQIDIVKPTEFLNTPKHKCIQ